MSDQQLRNDSHVPDAMIAEWNPFKEWHDWKCSCGWHLRVARSEVVANPMAMETARLAAAGHMKEAHSG